VAALTALGAVTGFALVGTGWAWHHRLPQLATVVIVVLAAALAGGSLGIYARARMSRAAVPHATVSRGATS